MVGDVVLCSEWRFVRIVLYGRDGREEKIAEMGQESGHGKGERMR